MSPRRLLVVLAASLATTAVAVPATLGAAKRTRHFTQHFVGNTISGTPTAGRNAYAVTDSLNGAGAAVQKYTVVASSPPLHGTDTAVVYFVNGAQRSRDTFTISAADAKGIATIDGSGHCTGGTAVHRHETCTYTFGGTLNTNTGMIDVKVTGTSTR